MYNRYCPREGYAPLDGAEQPRAQPSSGAPPLGQILAGTPGSLTGLLGRLGLSRLEGGDLFLLALLFWLYRETGDEEWLILLGLVLLSALR